MNRYEYMRIPVQLVPQAFMDKYALYEKLHKDCIYFKISKVVYGLPQSVRTANDLLKQLVGWFECMHISGLWCHNTIPVTFILVVDDFGIKYVGDKHDQHLINALQQHYTLEVYWEEKQYCGITLHCNYNNRTLNVSMM